MLDERALVGARRLELGEAGVQVRSAGDGDVVAHLGGQDRGREAQRATRGQELGLACGVGGALGGQQVDPGQLLSLVEIGRLADDGAGLEEVGGAPPAPARGGPA